MVHVASRSREPRLLARLPRRLLACVVALLLCATGAVATSAPAQAATCAGYGCDHQNPYGAGCFNGSEVIYDDYLGLAAAGNDPEVRLWYSPSCNTVWASIFNSVGPCCGSGTAYITRNSDRLTLYCPVPSGGTSCYTNMLYDGKHCVRDRLLERSRREPPSF